MGSFVQEAVMKVIEVLGTALDEVVGWMLDTWLGPFLESCLQAGTSAYNDMLNNAFSIMTMSPEKWSESGWLFILNEVNDVFVVFGCSLVTVFFLIGFCAESIDVRQEMRIETILKAFIKLSIAEFFVINTLKIVTTLFGLVAELTPFRKDLKFNITIDVNTADLLDMNAGAALLAVLLAFICMVSLIISGALITYTAYMRFFKILLVIPFGAIASSTIAGNHVISNTSVAFWKYVIGIVLEGLAMILALCLFKVIDTGGGLAFIALRGDFAIHGRLINQTLFSLFCLGAVKGSGAVVQKLLNL